MARCGPAAGCRPLYLWIAAVVIRLVEGQPRLSCSQIPRIITPGVGSGGAISCRLSGFNWKNSSYIAWSFVEQSATAGAQAVTIRNGENKHFHEAISDERFPTLDIVHIGVGTILYPLYKVTLVDGNNEVTSNSYYLSISGSQSGTAAQYPQPLVTGSSASVNNSDDEKSSSPQTALPQAPSSTASQVLGETTPSDTGRVYDVVTEADPTRAATASTVSLMTLLKTVPAALDMATKTTSSSAFTTTPQVKPTRPYADKPSIWCDQTPPVISNSVGSDVAIICSLTGVKWTSTSYVVWIFDALSTRRGYNTVALKDGESSYLRQAIRDVSFPTLYISRVNDDILRYPNYTVTLYDNVSTILQTTYTLQYKADLKDASTKPSDATAATPKGVDGSTNAYVSSQSTATETYDTSSVSSLGFLAQTNTASTATATRSHTAEDTTLSLVSPKDDHSGSTVSAMYLPSASMTLSGGASTLIVSQVSQSSLNHSVTMPSQTTIHVPGTAAIDFLSTLSAKSLSNLSTTSTAVSQTESLASGLNYASESKKAVTPAYVTEFPNNASWSSLSAAAAPTTSASPSSSASMLLAAVPSPTKGPLSSTSVLPTAPSWPTEAPSSSPSMVPAAATSPAEAPSSSPSMLPAAPTSPAEAPSSSPSMLPAAATSPTEALTSSTVVSTKPAKSGFTAGLSSSLPLFSANSMLTPSVNYSMLTASTSSVHSASVAQFVSSASIVTTSNRNLSLVSDVSPTPPAVSYVATSSAFSLESIATQPGLVTRNSTLVKAATTSPNLATSSSGGALPFNSDGVTPFSSVSLTTASANGMSTSAAGSAAATNTTNLSGDASVTQIDSRSTDWRSLRPSTALGAFNTEMTSTILPSAATSAKTGTPSATSEQMQFPITTGTDDSFSPKVANVNSSTPPSMPLGSSRETLITITRFTTPSAAPSVPQQPASSPTSSYVSSSTSSSVVASSPTLNHSELYSTTAATTTNLNGSVVTTTVTVLSLSNMPATPWLRDTTTVLETTQVTRRDAQMAETTPTRSKIDVPSTTQQNKREILSIGAAAGSAAKVYATTKPALAATLLAAVEVLRLRHLYS